MRILPILPLLLLSTLSGQSITLTEINPTSSTLDATNPNGASGGRVNKLAISGDGNSLYAASELGGLFRSRDRGNNWERLDGHLPTLTVDVEVSPADPNVVLATSTYDGRLSSLSGLNRSTDGGTSWTRPASFTPPTGFCQRAVEAETLSGYGIAFDRDNPDRVYAGTSCGLAISTNGGATWNFVDPTPRNSPDRIMDVVVHNGIVDIVGDDGHFRSTDNGLTWTTTSDPANALPSGIATIAVSPDEDYVLFATVGTLIFHTTDGGETWRNTMVNPAPQGRIPFVKVNNRTGTAYDLWFGDIDLHRCSCSTPADPAPGGSARCPDNTWTGPFTRTVGGHNDLGDILFDPTVSVDACPVAMASDGGVYLNTAGGSGCHSPAWEQPATTVRALWVFGMAGFNSEPGEYLYAGLMDNGTYVTPNASSPDPIWNNRDCCDGFDVAPNRSSVLYSVCCFRPGRFNLLFLRDRDMVGGREINTYPPGNVRPFFDGDLIVNAGGNRFIVATSTGVYFTTNIRANPITWNSLGSSNVPASVSGLHVATESSGNVVVYAQIGAGDGSGSDRVRRKDGLSVTGAWTTVDPPGGRGGFGVFDAHPTNPDRIIASHFVSGLSPQMLLSVDGGASWDALPELDDLMTGGGTYRYSITSELTPRGRYLQPSLVAFNPYDEEVIVAGAADAGLFISFDGGESWRPVTDPDDPSGIQVPRPKFAHFEEAPMPFGDNGLNVYIGTKGRGMFRMRIAGSPPAAASPCLLNPALCIDLDLDDFRIGIDCGGRFPCYGRDPIPRNCLVKYRCPGCEEVALCPPFYSMLFEDFPFEHFDLGLFHPNADTIDYGTTRVGKDLILTFRPSEALYEEAGIGAYELIFSARSNQDATIKARHEIATSIIAGDKPFEGQEDYAELKKLLSGKR
ncbi:photosystem II stability/assembly factor-like uncharacterized protein [Neolewinella xylanilytica]|uniref:Photosystem II stability/assembly factor-like uncharacterized protein n=1 Tax=Neolewinella xylanilytica TaxID=1514080 RepID=A0A2S6I9I3_9BACT|nr:hypothetical protein [Neolewinella xylanilytica]PPK88167.1 photosystem II stability/assembly factor-like uncharacterized protein [Neolewinella xylanilytica]